MSNYTEQMEDMIRTAAPLDADIAAQLAEGFGPEFSAKSVTAKAIRMGVAYNRKQPVSKTGAPVERKEAIVEQIAAIVEGNLAGLEKAPKEALRLLRDYLAA